MTRTDIINKVIDYWREENPENNYVRYLEIGVYDYNLNYNHINFDLGQICDPDYDKHLFDESKTRKHHLGGYFMKSDQMFELLDSEVENFGDCPTWDIIFIDGLHLEEQVKRDINNSLRFLNPGGYIIVHDCNPPSFELAQEEWIAKEWCGTTWKGWINFRETNSHLRTFTVDTDYGVGIITTKLCNLSQGNDNSYDWEYFSNHRKELLNLISIDEFESLLREKKL